VGGPARSYLESGDAQVLGEALATAARDQVPILVLGGGSNLLVADGGFDGLAIKYTGNHFEIVEEDNGTAIVLASAGLTIANLARRLARQGWTGLEWSSNVPGTIGGAAVNNAGAFRSCMADCLVDLELLDSRGRTRRLANADLGYEYRSSVLKRGELGPTLVTRARVRIRRDDPATATARIAELQRLRTESQPRQLSAGSVFANPPEDYAGRLIEAAGLKGARVGGAEISSHHANFIVNPGHATAHDVYALMRTAQTTVWERFGIWLRPEIQLVGAWEPTQLDALHGPDGERNGGRGRTH
jgi:UDP-N-acetylmuramate dehydrogenase